jgi:hypothetical protein
MSSLAVFLVATVLPLAAGAADAPKRKSGLWEVTTTSPQVGNRAVRIRECVDRKTDDMMEMDESMGNERPCAPGQPPGDVEIPGMPTPPERPGGMPKR